MGDDGMRFARRLMDVCTKTETNYSHIFRHMHTHTTSGIILCLVIVKLLECWANWQPAGSWPRLYISQSGNYGSPPNCKIWYDLRWIDGSIDTLLSWVASRQTRT
jgi:hypothetical protein